MAPLLPPNRGLATYSEHVLRCPPVILDGMQRCLVDKAIRDVCTHRGWTLHAINVRTNHVHLVVSATGSPDLALNTFKAWATRRLVESGRWARGLKPWARHGSTRYLWKQSDIEAASTYTLEAQDESRDSPLAPSPPRPLPHGRGSA
jgi:REP element-mobilizing transposase RayT